jgi:hypothetical protein
MADSNVDISGAACTYVLAGLLPRLERLHPGLLADVRSGIEGDRAAMSANGSLSPQVDSVVVEALRILEISGAK